MEHLCNEFTKLDYHQLIATAMLQGWALSSMLSKHSINISKLNKPSRAATAAEISLDTSGKGRKGMQRCVLLGQKAVRIS